ncbi:MAG TPA: glycosyltransferase family 1 protein [Parafilimonas sp.]|nr:glycosyltransferase family 1 protein [Parafilimonas sp.]
MHDDKKILVDVERMRYPNTGLYYYCLHLANALQQQQARHKARLGFYLRKETKSLFPTNNLNRVQYSLDKHHMSFAGKFDVWHCTFQGSNYFPASSKAKIVFTVHDLNFLHEKLPGRKQRKFLDALKKKVDRADVIITISAFVKTDLQANLEADDKKIKIIHNGCNINTDSAASTPAVIPQTPFIFTIGAITEKKNFHVLPGMLLKNDHCLVIAGITHNEQYRQKIVETAKRLGVHERVMFTGGISEGEKYWYLQNCVAFAFPSLAEGFGLPVIEAMHFGKPVLLSKATSLPEVGGNYAYYLDSFEPSYMSDELQHALDDHAVNHRAAKIIEWSEQFNWDVTAQKHWEIYESLL